MKIPSRFLDVTRRAIRIEHTMSSDYCLGMKGFNFVASFFIALREIEMRVVVTQSPDTTKSMEGTYSAVDLDVSVRPSSSTFSSQKD